MIIKLILLTIFFFIQPSIANTHWNFSSKDIKESNSAIEFALKQQWDKSRYHAKLVKDPIVFEIITWIEYKNASPQLNIDYFNKLVNFIETHPDWPELTALKFKIEDILDILPAGKIVEWCKKHPPITSRGAQLLVRAQESLYKNNKLSKEEFTRSVKEVFTNTDFSSRDENNYLKLYKNFLTSQDFINRINYLLNNDRITQASRIIDKLNQDHRKLFKARIEILKKPQSIEKILNSVPHKLRNDHGLLVDTLTWYEHKGDIKKIRNIFKKIKYPKQNQNKWWNVKIKQIRELIQEKKFNEAYQLTINHNNKNDADYVEAEWLAGWLSLRFLNNAQASYKHFENLYNRAKYPISFSRGAYWAGRASSAIEDLKNAERWYNIAAKYPWTFYGQLALLELDHSNLSLPKTEEPSDEDKKYYLENKLAKASYVLAKIDKIELAKIFSKASIIAAKTPGEIHLITDNIAKLNNHHLSAETSKYSIREKLLFTKTAYPKIENLGDKTEESLVLSIIRQESVFDKYAQSSAGALGMMQLLPSTAHKTAKNIKLKFNKDHLKSDHLYNIKLGSSYLSELIDKYSGSYILAIAAYNGGPTAVNRWINLFGDPRGTNNLYEILDWIELIPFYETRNYVQRVLETLQIYREIYNKKHPSLSLMLEKDLMR